MKKQLITLSIFATALFGCQDDFLDKEPSAFLTADQIAEAKDFNPGILEGTMTGTYSYMFTSGTGGTGSHTDFGQKGIDIYSDMLTGDMSLANSVYGWYRAAITEFKAPTDFTLQENYIPWRYFYRVIRSANLVIESVGGNDVVPASDEEKAIMGQAKAIRAHSYFNLALMYSKEYMANQEILPLYLNSTDKNGPKVTAGEIWTAMEKDLSDAVMLLDGYTRSNKSKINKSVAQVIYAYVLAHRGAWDDAYDQAKAVLMRNEFPVMNATELTASGFSSVSIPGWMWGIDLNTNTGVGLLSFWGQVDYYSYSYAAVGDRKVMDADLLDQIPPNDARAGQFLYNPASSFHGLPWYKFYDAGRVRFGAGTPVQNDIHFMRIAEVHLLAAEAAARGTQGDAVAQGHLIDLLSERVSNPTYVNGLAGQALIDEIYLQTRIELWGEGKSYWAMVRNQATTTRGFNHLSFVGVPIPYNDERLTFEIPRAEIQDNPFISSQND